MAYTAKVFHKEFVGWDQGKIEKEITKIMKKDGWSRSDAERYVNMQKGMHSGKLIYGKWKETEI
jgi:hypothetical protein